MKAAIFLNSGKKVQNFEGADLIICADGGYDCCPVTPDVIIGDCDSIKEIPNIEIIKHNPEKDETDGELCVQYAISKGATEIDFYGVTGGRCDHVLGNYTNMAYSNHNGLRTVAIEDGFRIYFMSKGHFKAESHKDGLLSIIPYGGNAKLSNSKNLYYPLNNLLMTTIQSRGISNVCLDNEISFDILDGSVLIFIY